MAVSALDAQTDFPGSAEGFEAVSDEVDQHLFELGMVGAQPKVGPGFEQDFRVAGVGIRSEEIADFGKDRPCREITGDRIGGTGKFEEPADDPFQAVDFGMDDLGVGSGRAAVLETPLLREEPGLDGREWIPDFVGNSRGKHAERRELLLPRDEVPAFNKLESQGADEIAVDERAEGGGENHDGYQGADEEFDEPIEPRAGNGGSLLERLLSEAEESTGILSHVGGMIAEERNAWGDIGVGRAVGDHGPDPQRFLPVLVEDLADVVEDLEFPAACNAPALFMEPLEEPLVGGDEVVPLFGIPRSLVVPEQGAEFVEVR